ncbi:hypothetical protein DL96DRAFT_1751423 [Flagelloscypha sp. PMI_526]|nr:hypothetical protein DL96DRAFT_1751423 [Flagelloscypha sp. PMI_526]
MDVTNVIVVGASGTLGPAIINAFLEAKTFTVSALIRPDSKANFPSDVKVVKADYTPSSLKSALAGQDVVVSVIGFGGYAVQKIVVDAAIAAGVKRFFPSEFGNETSAEAIAFLPVLQEKRDIIDYLISKESLMSWTVIQTGSFFDFGMKVGLQGFDLANRKVDLLDGGDTKFHATNLSTIGKAVVASLSTSEAYEKTKNQYVGVASHEVSQRDILTALEQITGEKFKVTEIDSETFIKSGQGSPKEVFVVIQAMLIGKVGLGKSGKLWNEILRLPKEDLVQNLELILEGKSA